MPPRSKKADTAPCEWNGQTEAFRRFTTHSGGTESQAHQAAALVYRLPLSARGRL